MANFGAVKCLSETERHGTFASTQAQTDTGRGEWAHTHTHTGVVLRPRWWSGQTQSVTSVSSEPPRPATKASQTDSQAALAPGLHSGLCCRVVVGSPTSRRRQRQQPWLDVTHSSHPRVEARLHSNDCFFTLTNFTCLSREHGRKEGCAARCAKRRQSLFFQGECSITTQAAQRRRTNDRDVSGWCPRGAGFRWCIDNNRHARMTTAKVENFTWKICNFSLNYHHTQKITQKILTPSVL